VTDYLQETEWSLPETLLVILAGLIGSILAQGLFVVSGGDQDSVLALGVVFAGQVAGSLLVMWLLTTRKGTGSFPRDFGLTVRLADWWAVFAGMGLQIGVALMLFPLIQLLYPDGPPQQEVATLTSESRGVFEVVLVFVVVAVLAPVLEEMIFRGMLLSRLTRSMSGPWAVVVTSAAFASIHLLDPSAIAAVPGLFIIGVILGFQALRRGNLSLAILTHAGVNLTAAILLVFGDDLVDWLEEMAENAEAIEGLLTLLR
jgi:membrane protease YdiL (CAAX protease family)